MELAPTHIRVNCVAPGVIRTDMLDALPPEVLPQLAQETPLGRLGTPEDIAHAVAFLAGDGASFITGQVLENPNSVSQLKDWLNEKVRTHTTSR